MFKNNKLNLVIHLVIILFTIYVAYLRFIRYLLADNESIAIAMLNPNQLPSTQPVLFSVIMLLVILLFVSLLKLKPSASFSLRTIKGLYGYCLALLLLQLIIVTAKGSLPNALNQPIMESKNLFVEVQAENTRLRAEPSLEAEILTTVDTGTLLLLNDVKKSQEYTWNRVLLAPKEYAWIVRVAKVSNNKKRLSKTNKFYFTLADQYSLILALFGFVWGILSFKRH